MISAAAIAQCGAAVLVAKYFAQQRRRLVVVEALDAGLIASGAFGVVSIIGDEIERHVILANKNILVNRPLATRVG